VQLDTRERALRCSKRAELIVCTARDASEFSDARDSVPQIAEYKLVWEGPRPDARRKVHAAYRGWHSVHFAQCLSPTAGNPRLGESPQCRYWEMAVYHTFAIRV
jgi:hypothetical protein